MNTLDAMLTAAEAFAREKLDDLPEGTQEEVATAVYNGCLLQLQITPCAKSRVRLVLLLPDGREVMQLGHLIDGQPH